MRLDRFGRRRGCDDSGSRHKMPESLAPESQRGDDETRGKAGRVSVNHNEPLGLAQRGGHEAVGVERAQRAQVDDIRPKPLSGE